MSQHDYVIDNAAGATVRADFNNALGAIVTNNSGTSAPSTTYAYQWWVDTTNGLLKQRNSTNSGWETVAKLPLRGLTPGTALTQNPYAINSTVTQAHGLGQEPDLITGYLECLSADLNYSTGDRVDILAHKLVYSAGGNPNGYIFLRDATNVVLITHATNVPMLINKSTRAAAGITAANWKIVLTPWRIG